MNSTMNRTCFVHAGTHKTASTYIQDRLLRNRRILRAHGLNYNFKGLSEKRHKPIAMDAKKGSLAMLELHLEKNARVDGNILLSAEQFTQPLSDPDLLAGAKKVAERLGFNLQVVIFIRPQLEYMNSRYIQGCKRFYYATGFNSYVKRCTGGSAQDIFNYHDFLGSLACSGICTFLPFGKSHGDPFQQLVQVLGLSPQLLTSLLPATADSQNAQPGAKGVWLARQVTKRMISKGFNNRSLSNTTKIITMISKSNGWNTDRFYGFTNRLALETGYHYSQSNLRFSQMVWGLDWTEVFTATSEDFNVYHPSSESEEASMAKHADDVLKYLASKNRQMARELIGCLAET